MNLADFLTDETRNKIINDSEKDLTPEKKDRLKKYRETYFHNTKEMIEYMRLGGEIVPVKGFAKEHIYMKDGKIYEHEMVVSDSGTILGYQTNEYSEEKFHKDKKFKVIDEGYIMFWHKKEIKWK